MISDLCKGRVLQTHKDWLEYLHQRKITSTMLQILKCKLNLIPIKTDWYNPDYSKMYHPIRLLEKQLNQLYPVHLNPILDQD